MTLESTLRELPGGESLLAHFGRVPRFHDANLLEITLRGNGTSVLRIHGWNMTNQVDDKGYYVLEKHAVVTLTLNQVTRVELTDFDMEAIIGFFEITKSDDGYIFSWDTAIGVAGSIRARQARFELVPGKP